MAGNHFYTLDSQGELAPESGYDYEGIACYAHGNQVPGTVPLYRWFHPSIGDHFYTQDAKGEAAPSSGYQYEGIACYVFAGQSLGTVPFYRWFHPNTGDHFYTMASSGELASQSGYIPEGVACFVYPSPINNSQPLYRWFQVGFMTRFTYDNNITDEQRERLIARHQFALNQIRGCNSLNPEEKRNLLQTYVRPIQHSTIDDANVFGRARINGNRIWINIDNLFPFGDNEISQTLIHEMMHCAGYTHPQRTNNDRPGDNGAYYSTPPLRSEICIAGAQSDVVKVNDIDKEVSCSIVNNECTIGPIN